MSRAKLRVCASCEWIFRSEGDCPKCGFGHYSAHYVYGARAYRYAKSQEPWMEKKREAYRIDLIRERDAAVAALKEASHDCWST